MRMRVLKLFDYVVAVDEDGMAGSEEDGLW
jgi:hypothetical protein